MNRRSFIKRASGLVAVVAAPLFIPRERLDFGVPRRQIIVPEPISNLASPESMPFFVGRDRMVQVAGVVTGANPTISAGLTLQESDAPDGQWIDVEPVRIIRGTFVAEKRYIRAVGVAPSIHGGNFPYTIEFPSRWRFQEDE